jgi:2-hydroxy-3-keto-5-methylthiopentenyl-1-phosphate phosphatase
MHHSLNALKRLLKVLIHAREVSLTIDIRLDPGFATFYDWTLNNNIPVIILSSGMEPIIRALLSKFIGSKAQAIPILSNNVEIALDNTWRISFRDESRIVLERIR